MKSKILCIFCSMSIVFSLLVYFPTGIFAESAKEPDFIISSLEDLIAFRDNVNSGNTYTDQLVRLNTDIDLSSIENWKPIGTTYPGFCGTFDGNNKTISNMKMRYSPDWYYYGFFGFTNCKGIKNLKIKDADINIQYEDNSTEGEDVFIGTLCAIDIVDSSIDNISISSKITAEYTFMQSSDTNTQGGSLSIGGITSYASRITINNCEFSGEITSNTADYIGGLVQSAHEINNSHANIKINSNNNDSQKDHYVGGLAGNTCDNITKSYSIGNINCNNAGYIGGLIGNINYGALTDSYSKVTINCINAIYIGGLVANTCSEMKNSYYYSNIYCIKADNIGGLSGNGINGITENCYSKGNIYCDNCGSVGGISGNSTRTMINSYSTMNISGNKNEQISCLYNLGGLVAGSGNFDNCFWSGTILCNKAGNIGGLSSFPNEMLNCHTSGYIYCNESDNLGGLTATGDCINCYSTITIDSEKTQNIGGLTGSGDIINSYYTGKLTCDTASNIGGLSGSSSKILNSYSSCYIKCNKIESTGGVLTGNGDTIINSFAKGNISSNKANQIGGFVGDGSKIYNCYSTSSVNCQDAQHISGFCASEANIINSYTSCTTPEEVATNNVTYKPLQQMQTPEFAQQLNQPLDLEMERELFSQDLVVCDYYWKAGVNDNLPTIKDILNGFYLDKNSFYVQAIDTQSEKVLKSFKVYIDNKVFNTDKYGYVKINDADLLNQYKDITIKANGFQMQTSYQQLKPGKRIFLLNPTNGKPYITNATNSKHMDLLTSDDYITQTDRNYYSLKVQGDWIGKTPRKYVIYQINGTVSQYLESTTGEFRFVPGDIFDIDSVIMIKMIATDGTESLPRRLYLHVYQDAIQKKLEDQKIETIGDNDITIIEKNSGTTGNSWVDKFLPEFSLEPAVVDATLQVEKDTDTGCTSIKVLYGLTDKSLFSNDRWEILTQHVLTGDLMSCANKLYGSKAALLTANKDVTRVTTMTKMFKNPRMSIDVYGCSELVFDKNGNLAEYKGNILLEFEAKGTLTRNFIVPIGPIPIPMYAELGIKLTADASGGIKYSASDNFKPKLDFTFTITPDMYVGVGIGTGTAGYGIGLAIEIGASMDIQLFPDSEGKLTAYLRFHAYLGPWDYKENIAKKTYTLWPQKKKANKYNSSLDMSELTLIDQGFLDKTTAWNTSDLGLNGAAANISTLQDYILPNTTPHIAKIGNKLVMTFQSASKSRSAVNNSILMYSVFENNKWSEPKEVWDNGTSDSKSTMKVINNKLYIAWEKLNKTIDGSDSNAFNDYFNSSEIAFAEWDNVNNTFVNKSVLTNNNSVDMMPTIAGNNDEISVVWVNKDTDTCFDLSSPSNIYSSTFKNGVWTSNIKIKTVTDYISELNADYNNSKLNIAYISMNNNDESVTDVYRISDGSTTKLSNSDSVQCGLTYLDGLLYWQNNGTLYCYDGTKTSTFSTGDSNEFSASYKLIHNNDKTAIIWAENSNETYTVKASILNPEGWSNPITLIEPDSETRNGIFVESLDGQITDDNTWKLILKTNKSSETDEKTSIVFANIDTKTDLELTEVFCSDDNRTNGSQPVSLTIKNNGQTTINNITLSIKDNKGQTYLQKDITCSVLPGQESTISESFNINSISSITDFTATVNILNDNTASNNSKNFKLGYSKLTLSYNKYNYDNKILLSTKVTNNSTTSSKATLKLREDSKDGNIVEMHNISSLDDNRDFYSDFTIDKSKIDFKGMPSKYYYLELSAENNEDVAKNLNQLIIVYNDLYIPATNLSFNEKSIKMNVNETRSLIPIVTPTNATEKKFNWESTDEAIAKVSSDGKVTALKAGKVIITVLIPNSNILSEITICISDNNNVTEIPKVKNPETNSVNYSYILIILASIAFVTSIIFRKKHDAFCNYNNL